MIAVPRIITSLLILAIILSGCSHTAPTTTSVIDHKTKSAEEELEASQHSVYDAVINKMYLEDDRIGLVVIEDQTTLGLSQEREWEKELEYAGKIMPERLRLLSADIFNNFRAKNQTSTPLQQLFNLRVKCILISKNELDEMFRQRNDRSDGWVTFFEKYPTSHGITYLSNVG